LGILHGLPRSAKNVGSFSERRVADARKKRSALVVGAGDATGGAIARRFAREGYATVCTRREVASLDPLLAKIRADGGEAHGFGSDARIEEEVVALFEKIETEIAPLEVVIFNIGANVNFPIRDTTARVYRKVWEMAAFGGFLAGREAAKVMVPRGKGTIIFTGATASMRGGAGFSAFSGAKFALRSLAQSMARELGGRKASMSRTQSSTARSTPSGSPRISRSATR
jgi:NAD(P)-dependent dehydrogenase (short-subunit alcohol dehydrogenase family)